MTPIDDTIITTVPQADGSVRTIKAQDAAHAAVAREILASDPAMIDHLHGTDGIRITTVDGPVPVRQMSQTPVSHKTRTITLTGRPPVKIREDQWPEIASANDDTDESPGRTKRSEEVDEYSIRVRQHADGRVLVYAVLDAAIAAWRQPAGGKSRRGGELLDAESVRARRLAQAGPSGEPVQIISTEIVAAIRRVGEDCQIPDSVIRACIADLPAEEL